MVDSLSPHSRTRPKVKQRKTAKAVLQEVAALLERNKSNWTRHFMFRRRGTAEGGEAVCALGAIRVCADNVGVRRAAERLLQNTIREDHDERGDIAYVNDQKGYKVILARIKEAAE